MRKLIFILFAFWCFSCFGQDLTHIKHIELISEVKDTMIMINKEDADKINKTYFLKNQLDTIISELKVKSLKQENIIKEQQEIVNNYKKIVKEQKDQNEKLIKDSSTLDEDFMNCIEFIDEFDKMSPKKRTKEDIIELCNLAGE